MIQIIDDFQFCMLPKANNGSFEFHEIDKNETKNLLYKNKYIAYITDHEMAETLRKDLEIEVIEQTRVRSFYDNDEFILVKNQNTNLLGDIVPKYFHCIVHSDTLITDNDYNS